MTTIATTELETLDQQVLAHLRELNIASVHEYRQWCFEHGFSRGLNKHPTMRAEELRVRGEKFQSNCKQRQRESRQPLTTLLASARGEVDSHGIQHPVLRYCAERIEACVQSSPATIDRTVVVSFLNSLVKARAKFVTAATESIHLPGLTAGWIDGLLNLCQHHGDWVRPLNEWRPKGHNVRRQFASLLRHLLARYDDIPAFMDGAWLATGDASSNYRQWYVHLGQGKNLRHCQLPLSYTKRMAHHFMRAPECLTIPQALRYGHVMGFGCDHRTAMAVLATRLSDHFEEQPFWESVLRWIIDHPMLDRAQIGPIIDFIHYHKFAGEQELVASATTDQPSPAVRQPNFSMRGRTSASLLKQVHRWHGKLAQDNSIQRCEWQPIGINPLVLVEGHTEDKPSTVAGRMSFKRWSIRELLSTQALVAEGRKLGHCVASYANSCARRQSSIWTLELVTESGLTKLLTIEVNPQIRAIVQVRGRFNRLAKENELKIIRRWAEQENLRQSFLT